VDTLESIKSFCAQCGKRPLILDTNIFLLFLIGNADKKFIRDTRCTQKFTPENYDTLLIVFRYFKNEILITPHILTEISNFSIRDISEPRLSHYFARKVERLKLHKEENIPLTDLLGMDLKLLTRFGFTDMGIIDIAKKTGAVIFSDDMGLCLHANSQKIPSINFTTLTSKV